MADVVYSVGIHDAEILTALQRINKSIDKIAADGSKAFDGVQKSANLSGVQIGAISGIVSSLTTAFINLGKQALDALVGIGEKAVETALEIDTLKARLRGIFDGSQEAADQAFTFIQQKSKELGIDLSELAGAFIPKTESLEQFERVAKIATALARSDPEQGAIGARIALLEALSGTFTSLQRRFEIPKQDINRIKEAFDTQGIEGFISKLEEVLAESGKSFEDFTDTATTSFARVGIAGEQIGGRIGVPIVESLQAAADKILDFLNTNEDDIIVFADTIGRSIADVIDLLAGIDLSSLDTQSLIDVADNIFRVIESIKLVIAQLTLFGETFGITGESANLFLSFVAGIDDALLTAAQILALARAGYEGLGAAVASIIPVFEALFTAATKAATLDYLGAAESLGQAAGAAAQAQFDLQAGQDAARASFEESLQSFDAYQQAVEGNTTAQDDLRKSLDETANAGTSQADAILAAASAARELEQATTAAAEAQAKVDKAFADAKQDFDRKLEDIDIASERKRLDIAIEFAQKREGAATDNLRKLADIQRKNSAERADAAKDLERKEQDISRKFADERIDLEREQRQKRVDIETAYRLKLQDIQRQFLLDADEAESRRDAVAFLRAVKERDKQVQEAQIDRSRSVTETQVTGQQKLAELRIQQQREIEEAHLANERKVEDLRASLERAIEDQNIAYARQLTDLAEGEQRKNEEAARARERDIEDAKLAYERKLADLRVALETELALLAEFAARKAAIEAEVSAPRAPGTGARAPSRGGGLPPAGTSRQGQVNADRQRAARSGGRRRQHGGPVSAGQPYMVGERGPELFVPQSSGRIRANVGGAAGGTVNNSLSRSINLSVPADRLTPGQRAEARMLALEVLDGVT